MTEHEAWTELCRMYQDWRCMDGLCTLIQWFNEYGDITDDVARSMDAKITRYAPNPTYSGFRWRFIIFDSVSRAEFCRVMAAFTAPVEITEAYQPVEGIQ